MPRVRVYDGSSGRTPNAERQAAYRERKKRASQDQSADRGVANAEGGVRSPGEAPDPFVDRMMAVGEAAIEQFFKPDPKPSKRKG